MIHFLAVMMGKLSALARRCPACKRIQLLPRRRKRENVRCKFCGKEIPPVRSHPG